MEHSEFFSILNQLFQIRHYFSFLTVSWLISVRDVFQAPDYNDIELFLG